MNKIKLSVLEFGVRTNPNPRAVVGEIMDYAATADKLNFHRFWLAEHHEADTSASFTNPEIVITLIASSTRKIRIGAGGALIGYTSPYTLASNYKFLNNLFSNRIDFGLSKGKPNNVNKHDYFRLRDKTHSELFVDHLEAITELYENEEENFSEKEIVIPPYTGTPPALWYLSNSYKDIKLALQHKFNYCRSLFHGLDSLDKPQEKEELLKFKEAFHSQHNYYPDVALAICISFTSNEDEIQTYESANKDLPNVLKVIAVTIDSLFDLLISFQTLYGIDEFIILDMERDNKIKKENLQLINQRFEL